MPRHAPRLIWVLVLCLLALSLATCISAEERDYLRYDAAKDQFQMLMVLQDIQAKEEGDLNYLANYYKNRDHLIAPTLPGGAQVFPLAAISFLRMAPDHFAQLNLFASPPQALQPMKTSIPLDSITIAPGQFFLQDKKLGYYQAITVPGKTMDAALEELSLAAQTNDLAKLVNDEIARRDGGGKPSEWARFKNAGLKSMTIDEPATAPAASPPPSPTPTPTPTPGAATEPDDSSITPLMVLEPQSLKNLQQALEAKSLRIRRNKETLNLELPLTATDSREFADLIKQIKVRLAELITSTKETKENAEKLAGYRAMYTVGMSLAVAPNARGEVISFYLATFARDSAMLPPHRIDMNDKNSGDPQAVPPDAVAFLRTQKIPIDETLTAEQIVKDFNAGTLKNPLHQAVKPGEGFEIAPPAPAGGPGAPPQPVQPHSGQPPLP